MGEGRSFQSNLFFIGDIIPKDQNTLNHNLKKPIVMDITIENEYHHNHSGVEYIKSINEGILTSLFRRTERKDMDTLNVLLKFAHAEALSNKTRTRLVLHYLKCVGKGYSYSDKVHKNLIKLLRRVTLPQHQFLLEPKFANSYYRISYNLSGSSTYRKEDIDTIGYLGISGYGSSINNFIPMEEDTLDLLFDDIDESLYFNSNTERFSSDEWNSYYKDWNVFEGTLVEATANYKFGDCNSSITIKYFSPDDKEDHPILLESSGSLPYKNNYGISTRRFSDGSKESRDILQLMKPFIKNDKYRIENINNTGYTSLLYSPLKNYVETYTQDFCKENFGARSLRLLSIHK